MAAIMLVLMHISDPSWMNRYFIEVPKIFKEYGGLSIAGGTSVESIEGCHSPPERVAILSFPSLGSIQAFMSDARYTPFLQQRKDGSQSDIFIFDNLVGDGELV